MFILKVLGVVALIFGISIFGGILVYLLFKETGCLYDSKRII